MGTFGTNALVGRTKLATNKNQHFVPRCYLRPFTHREDGKAIRLFNLDRESVIDNAAVKHQCSGSYFYGEDELLEQAIQSMEQAYAATLRRVRDGSYRKLLDQDEMILKRFWLLQYLRTEAASKRAVEMNNQIGELVGAEQSFRLEIKEAVTIGMQTFAEQIDIIDDLSSCLVRNASALPLITSDDPAILTNRWFKADPRNRGETFGLASAGIVAVLPLDNNMAFVAYDPAVYSITKNFGIMQTKRVGDIQAINQLQLLNCRANIFPGSEYRTDELVDAFRSCRVNRIDVRHILHYSVLDYADGEYKRYRVVEDPNEVEHREALVHSQTLFPSPNAWPKFLQWRRKGFGMVNGTRIGCVRKSRVEQYDGPPFEKMYTRH